MRIRPLLVLLLLAGCLSAQQDRIVGKIDTHQTVTLKGNVRPEAQPQYDQGPADPALRIGGMTLVLKKSPSQQADLEKLLIDQQDASSPEYHRWLTPQQYADRFGVSRVDLAKIADWLKGEGFTIDYEAQGRNWILFSGSAGQVLKSLGTEIHRYRVHGEAHFANSTDPSIPAALEPLALALMGLDDFYPKSPIRYHAGAAVSPQYTTSAGNHESAPGDLGAIYDISPLWTKGFDGTGMTIAVTGQHDIDLTDVAVFRGYFGLPANTPQKVLVPSSAAPAASCCEAQLDLEWNGAIAPNASQIFVYAHSASTAAYYAIDQNLAPVVTYSFLTCDPKISSGSAGASANQAEAQKANALGITWVASSGDAGAAGCDPNTAGTLAQYGLAVASPSSIPEVTGAGGTEFNEGSGTYWNSSNATGHTSALGYIPEKVWNDSSSASTSSLSSSGGGASIYYAKPAWQTGPGVPNDGQRDVPDISFTASASHDGYMYAGGGVMKCCI